MSVVDASVLVEYVGGGPRQESATTALAASEELWAPHLIDAEVGHALRRAVLAGELGEAESDAALADLRDLGMERVAHGLLMGRAWDLRHNLSFYDALYVALAETLGVALLTFDARIARASGLRAEVRVLD